MFKHCKVGLADLLCNVCGFGFDSVEVIAAASVNGNVKFTVAPKTAREDVRPPSYFFRVMMK